MGQHSLAEARHQLTELIDRARSGEEVVITREGRPVAEIKPVSALGELQPSPGPVSKEALDWLKAHRVGTTMPSVDAATLVSQMREEEGH